MSGQIITQAGSVAVGSITGLGTGVGTWLATPSGANLASALTTPVPVSAGGTGQATAALARTTGLGLPATWNHRTGREMLSPLTESGTFLLIEDTAYWVYVGQVVEAVTVKHVEFVVGTGGTGAQTAEVAIASSPLAPNKANQTLTKIAADGTLSDLTGTGIMRNTSSMAAAVPAGTHLWAGIRTAMATNEPTLVALTRDWAHGNILVTATAGALTGSGPWTGALVAHALTAQHPALRVVLD